MKGIAVVRSRHCIDDEVGNMCRLIRRILPDIPIIVSVDALHSDGIQDAGGLAAARAAGCVFVLRTAHSIIRQELSYVGPKTGWLCGDYALYSCLDLKWDFAWLIEPDVGMINGADHLFGEMFYSSDYDFIGACFRPAETSWPWRARIERLTHFPQYFAMRFPLVRASRDLVEAAYSCRQQIARKFSPLDSHSIPNDESLFATVAGCGNFSCTSFEDAYPGLFSRFQAVPRYLAGDVELTTKAPGFVHSYSPPDRYWKYVSDCIRRISCDDPTGSQRFEFLVKQASDQLRPLLIEFRDRQLSDMRSDSNTK